MTKETKETLHSTS